MKADLARDPSTVDASFPPGMSPLFFEERLLGLIYLANGKGPHKTLVFLHGFPGNEKNLDIAHMLSRCGINVLVFHYSGCWGSRGSYSFGQAYSDLGTVRRTIADEGFSRLNRIDRDRVFLAGHSVGGFLTLLAARDRMDFRGFAPLAPYNLSMQANRIEAGDKAAYEETYNLFSCGLNPLEGASAESLLEEIREKREEWDLLVNPAPFHAPDVMLVIASSDTVAPPPVHQFPLADLMKRAGGPKRIVELSCSHDFSEKRIALAEALYEWLEDR